MAVSHANDEYVYVSMANVPISMPMRDYAITAILPFNDRGVLCMVLCRSSMLQLHEVLSVL